MSPRHRNFTHPRNHSCGGNGTCAYPKPPRGSAQSRPDNAHAGRASNGPPGGRRVVLSVIEWRPAARHGPGGIDRKHWQSQNERHPRTTDSESPS